LLNRFSVQKDYLDEPGSKFELKLLSCCHICLPEIGYQRKSMKEVIKCHDAVLW